MARLPNGCSRMLCALLQFGSEVSAVNKPSPPTARTRRSEPRTALSKRFSSLSSSTRSWPETITIGAPIMSSQKIGPSSLASRAKFCTGALESSDSMLPTTGLVGGCGIGLSLLLDAICESVSCPVLPRRHPEEPTACGRLEGWPQAPSFPSHPSRLAEGGSHLTGERTAFVPGMTFPFGATPSPKPLSTPLDQLVADF